jgi:prophage DNA circulation protein
MSWRDQMGPATFRGVPFFVDTAERSGGRRTVKHEYPNRDEPFIEDMGRRAGSYPVEGYVLGADYLAARNALIAALETEGPGELVHPYYGTLRVICSTFRVREAAGEGGVARLSIEFEQTTATPIQPTAVSRRGPAGDQFSERRRACCRGRVSGGVRSFRPARFVAGQRDRHGEVRRRRR